MWCGSAIGQQYHSGSNNSDARTATRVRLNHHHAITEVTQYLHYLSHRLASAHARGPLEIGYKTPHEAILRYTPSAQPK